MRELLVVASAPARDASGVWQLVSQKKDDVIEYRLTMTDPQAYTKPRTHNEEF